MATNSRLARALQLQRIANTSRKLIPAASTTPTTTPDTPTILKSLPKHKPLLPLLLSHSIPSKVAQACADRFDRYANQLRSETETKLVPYLVNRRKNQPSRVYSFFLNSYSQALRDWAQSILDATLKSLKRTPTTIHNWDVTYPPPLWLPSPLDPGSAFTHKRTQTPSPLSPISAPPHAFPTTYPPPRRPPSRIPPVEWPRALATSSGSHSTSTIDLDSLCIQFTRSLVIDENPARPVQPKTSIFSLPDNLQGRSDVTNLRTKRPKSRTAPVPTQRPAKTISLTSPRKAVKSRQLSMPPSFPQTATGVRPTSRKFSAPVTSSLPGCNATQSTLSDPLSNLPPIISPSPTPPLYLTGGLDAALTLQNSPRSSSGPTTPPSLSSDLFSEPIVVSPASIQLLEPPPTAQSRPQYDFFSRTLLTSLYDDPGSSFYLPPDSFFQKDAFDAGSIMGCLPTSFTSEPSMNDFFYL